MEERRTFKVVITLIFNDILLKDSSTMLWQYIDKCQNPAVASIGTNIPAKYWSLISNQAGNANQLPTGSFSGVSSILLVFLKLKHDLLYFPGRAVLFLHTSILAYAAYL